MLTSDLSVTTMTLVSLEFFLECLMGKDLVCITVVICPLDWGRLVQDWCDIIISEDSIVSGIRC